MVKTGGKVFLCYRRGDSRHIAGRIADRLTELGRVQVFMDVDALVPGEDFTEAISEAVSSCNILLAVIGPNWLTASDMRGSRRLDNSDDWIRQEIRVALKRDIRVVPVLVDEASMPTAADLPADLTGLARRNAVRVDHETFATDILRLLDVVGRGVQASQHYQADRRRQPNAVPRLGGSTSVGAPGEVAARPTGRIVPLYRSAFRIILWIAAFALGLFAAVGLGLALANKVPGNLRGAIIATIVLFLILGGLLYSTRKEVKAQRTMYRQHATAAETDVAEPTSLSPLRFRILSICLGVVIVAFTLLAWLTTP